MRRLFALSTTVLTVVTVVQFYLAAMATFDPAPNDESFSAHRAVGYALMFAALAVTAVGAITRAPRRLVRLVGLSAGLVLLQALIVAVAKTVERSTPADIPVGDVVFGLHAINALLIVAILHAVSEQAWRLPGAGPEVASQPGRPVDDRQR